MPAANQIFSLFVVKTTVFSSHLYYNNTEPRNPDCHKAFHITVTVFLSHINSKNKGELTMIRRIIHINEENVTAVVPVPMPAMKAQLEW